MFLVLAESTSNNDRYNRDYYKYFTSWDDEPNHPQTRPILTCINTKDTCERYLKQEIHDWFTSFKVSYLLKYRIDKRTMTVDMWGIDILDENMAMLFKLTWM